jgi:hypothetical protein
VTAVRVTPVAGLVSDPAAHAYALSWRCDVCDAKANVPCMNPIDPDRPLPGRLVHFARLVDRRREPKESE